MAWNRLSENKPLPTPKRHGVTKGLIAGAIVAIGAIAIFYFLSPSKPQPEPGLKDKPKSVIKEVVKPAKAHKPKPIENPDVDKEGRPKRIGQIINGLVKLPSGRFHKVVGVHTAKVARVSLIERTFENPVDQDLAQLVLIEPGSEVVGDSSDYYENFKEQFLECCKTPITIEPTDSPEVKILKEVVVNTRKEIDDAIRSGEDITKLMRESREQLRELGLYKEELRKQIDQILESDEIISEQDIIDLRTAANKMLEDRGIAPLHLDTALIYELKMQQLEEQETYE